MVNVSKESTSERKCWICYQTEENDPNETVWLHPCKCRGSIKWVHKCCLSRWITCRERADPNKFVACPQCVTPYYYVRQPDRKMLKVINFTEDLMAKLLPFIFYSFMALASYACTNVLDATGMLQFPSEWAVKHADWLIFCLPVPAVLITWRMYTWCRQLVARFQYEVLNQPMHIHGVRFHWALEYSFFCLPVFVMPIDAKTFLVLDWILYLIKLSYFIVLPAYLLLCIINYLADYYQRNKQANRRLFNYHADVGAYAEGVQ